MNPKLTLDRCIYTLTAGRVLHTNVFQINLGKLLFRATLRVRLGSCLSTAVKMDNLDCTKINAHFKNSQLVSGRGSFTSASIHCLLAPPLPLMSVNNSQPVPHTATVEISCLQHTKGKVHILSPAQHSKHLATVTNYIGAPRHALALLLLLVVGYCSVASVGTRYLGEGPNIHQHRSLVCGSGVLLGQRPLRCGRC